VLRTQKKVAWAFLRPIGVLGDLNIGIPREWKQKHNHKENQTRRNSTSRRGSSRDADKRDRKGNDLEALEG